MLARGYRAGTFLDKWLFIRTRWSWCEILSTRPVGLEDGVSGGSEVPLRFKSKLMWDYGSWDCAGRVWCPILGQYLDADEVTVSQLFPNKHDQDTMDAIFGKIDPPELLSSRNGPVMSAAIKKYFDSGIFVIVPEVPDRSTRALFSWKKQEVRDCKARIIDPEWEMLDIPIGATTLIWGEFDNRKLQIPGRTAACRTLYLLSLLRSSASRLLESSAWR